MSAESAPVRGASSAPDEAGPSGLSGPSGPGGVPADRRRALVIGASSGMGAALVRQLAAEGYRVAAVARRAAELEQLRQSCAPAAARSGGAVFVHAHDVQHVDEVPALFETIVRELGGLDLLLYVAAIMPRVGPAEFDTGKDLPMVAVNFGGCVAWCNPTAALFRSQRSGTIVGISSVAGDRGRKGQPVYAATKAAMNSYLESLRNRLAAADVHVCTIKPGFVDTPMIAGMEKLFWVISPETAAATILRAARARKNVRYVPYRWMFVGLVLRSIPSFIFRKFNF